MRQIHATRTLVLNLMHDTGLLSSGADRRTGKVQVYNL
jgi:hypothetical protein